MVETIIREVLSSLELAKQILAQKKSPDAIEYSPGKCLTKEGNEYSLEYVQMILMELPPISLMLFAEYQKMVYKDSHE